MAPVSPLLKDYLEQQLSHFASQDLTTAQLAQLTQLLAASSFIGRTLQQQPELLPQFCDSKALMEALAEPCQVQQQILALDETAAFTLLRRYRNAQLCRILAADILQLHSIEHSLLLVSTLANNSINAAYHWAYQQLAAQWGTPLDQQGKPMPLLILGMGKLGGQELNFSSDIDLIFTYPANGETSGGRRSCENQQFFTRLGQKLIGALHQVTADGFVYRVDMRLRPFGDSGPLVLSFAAIEDYYQEQGREWERYAMLKARVLNPDGVHSQELQQLLRPFIYRRYIDFSAIESLRRMKQQIEQENRRLNRRDNIKLGAGGIREIEFIVQVFQLIYGGSRRELQDRQCLVNLHHLGDAELLDQQAVFDLEDAYLFLRRVEHAIQALNDQQTQSLPSEPELRQRMIDTLGFSDWNSFLNVLNQKREQILNLNLYIKTPIRF